MAVGGSEALGIPRSSPLAHVVRCQLEKIMLSDAFGLGDQLEENVLEERNTSPKAAAFHSLLAQIDATGARPNLETYFLLNIAFHTALVTRAANPVSAPSATCTRSVRADLCMR